MTVQVPRGYAQLTGLELAKGLTIPVGANAVLIQAEDADIRFRDDGEAPTAFVGYPLAVGDEFWYTSADGLSKLKFIETTPSAKINLLFYGI